MVLKLTLHLSEPGRDPIATAGGSSAIAFGGSTAATAAQNAGLPACDWASSGRHNRSSNEGRAAEQATPS